MIWQAYKYGKVYECSVVNIEVISWQTNILYPIILRIDVSSLFSISYLDTSASISKII